MRISPYTLAQPDDSGLWLLNGLHGSALHLTQQEWESFSDGDGDDVIARLLAARIVETSPGTDARLYRTLVNASATNDPAWRLGYLLDALSPEDVTDTIAFTGDVLDMPREPRGKVMVYAWYFTPQGRGRLVDLARVLERLPRGGEGRFIAIHTDATSAVGDAELEALEVVDPALDRAVAVFLMTPDAVEALGGPEPYAARVFEEQSRFYALGCIPFFIIRCTAASADHMLGPVFQALCFSGVYPRNLYVTYSREARDPLDVTCELYSWDWALYHDVGARIGRSPQHRVLEPLSVGFADKLRALFRDRSERPLTTHCPFARQSFIFGGDGHVTSCPVAHARLAEEFARFEPLVTGNLRDGRLDWARQRYWEARGPLTADRCGSCRVAPQCGSGCPLAAFEEHGDLYASPCPPAASILAQEAQLAGRGLAA